MSVEMCFVAAVARQLMPSEEFEWDSAQWSLLLMLGASLGQSAEAVISATTSKEGESFVIDSKVCVPV